MPRSAIRFSVLEIAQHDTVAYFSLSTSLDRSAPSYAPTRCPLLSTEIGYGAMQPRCGVRY
eukprot:2101511-Rhodomonas_salina.2